MAINHQFLANQAWKAMITHTRTDFMTYLDKTIQYGFGCWMDFNCNNHDTNGPSDLWRTEWYMKNKFWGNWLTQAYYWAKFTNECMQERLVEFQKMCAVSRKLFKDMDDFMTDVFWTKVMDTILLLECYLHGWKYAYQDLSFLAWIDSHPNAAADLHDRPVVPMTQV